MIIFLGMSPVFLYPARRCYKLAVCSLLTPPPLSPAKPLIAGRVCLVPRRLSRARKGRWEGDCCLYPSHGRMRLITSRSPLPCERWRLRPGSFPWNKRDLLIQRREGLRVRDLTERFFAYSQTTDSQKASLSFWIKRKVITVIFIEGGSALSRSQNDKFTNIW